MMRHLLLFAVMFIIGVALAVAIRTAMHHTTAATTAPVAAPATATTSVAASAGPATGTIVNSICAICGMPVNSALGTAEYNGKRIGFGCVTCPAKFAANPNKYGPAALENKVVSE